MKIISYFLFLLVFVKKCNNWRALPASNAMYAERALDQGIIPEIAVTEIPDDQLPRDQLNHVYKFGWCTMDATQRVYLRKSLNLTLPTYQDTKLNYIYLIDKKHTVKYQLQCIVMKSFVPQKFLFRKTRLPLYYCQGILFILMLNTIKRYDLHEFYFNDKVNMPINFNFEFYHPTAL